jgi:transketolase
MAEIDDAVVVRMLRRIAERIETEKDHLCALDSAVGDGDHGVSMTIGMRGLTRNLDELESPTAAQAFRAALGGVRGRRRGRHRSDLEEVFEAAARTLEERTDLSSSEDPTLTKRSVNAIRALTIDATQASGDGHPGMPMGAARDGLRALPPRDAPRPGRPDLVGPRPLRPVERPRLDAAVRAVAPHRVRRLDGRPARLPPVGVDHARAPRGEGTPPASRRRPGRWAKGSPPRSGWRWPRRTWRRGSTGPGHAVVDHHTFVLAGDGCMMEGVASEASSLAGHLGLGKLIVLYDDNGITIDGSTDIAFSEDVGRRYEAYGWHVQRVEDGNDVDALDAAVEAAKAETERPSLIVVRTTIGYGSPALAGTSKIHGSVLGDDEAVATKRALAIDWPAFTVPDDVLTHYREQRERGAAEHAAWRERWQAYEAAHPELAAELARVMRASCRRAPSTASRRGSRTTSRSPPGPRRARRWPR